MKTRTGMLSDTNTRAMTALSFGVANAAASNANRWRRPVRSRLMARPPLFEGNGDVSVSPRRMRHTRYRMFLRFWTSATLLAVWFALHRRAAPGTSGPPTRPLVAGGHGNVDSLLLEQVANMLEPLVLAEGDWAIVGFALRLPRRILQIGLHERPDRVPDGH